MIYIIYSNTFYFYIYFFEQGIDFSRIFFKILTFIISALYKNKKKIKEKNIFEFILFLYLFRVLILQEIFLGF